MSTARRIFVSVGAPLVVVVGLAVAWGVRNANVLKHQVETWADEWEHSPNPVTMHLAGLPIPRPVFVDGKRIGSLDVVVVQRHAPQTIDGVRLEVHPRDGADLHALAGCNLRFDPDALEHNGLEGFTRTLQCVSDVSDLVDFGTVTLEGTDVELGLFLDRADLPCDHMGEQAAEACLEVGQEIDRIRERVRTNVKIRF